MGWRVVFGALIFYIFGCFVSNFSEFFFIEKVGGRGVWMLEIRFLELVSVGLN